jgi:dimethylargininase
MLTAITHQPSPLINNCELTFVNSTKIDFKKAETEHKNYCRMLSGCGVEVITLNKNKDFPDSAFVEDTAIVLDELAIITPMGVSSRADETKLIEEELIGFRALTKIKSPARIEGGDVLRIGKTLFTGLSSRTNSAGIKALKNITGSFGYEVLEVRVRGSLHLKTACTALDDETILCNPEWIETDDLKKFNLIEVASEEPFAANILKINNEIFAHAGFPKTNKKIEHLGYNISTTDISEFLKAEAGLTCLSLLFDSS